MNKLDTVLIKIAEALSPTGILWGVGASVLLRQYKLIDNPSDIDLIVSINDVEKTDEILSLIGEKLPENKSDIYLTEYFYEYIIDGINIDVMAGLKIKTNGYIFKYIFDKNSIPRHFDIGKQTIPFTSLEDWFVLYQLMPRKEYKAELIYNYFKKNGIKHPPLIERMTENPDLPISVLNKIKELQA